MRYQALVLEIRHLVHGSAYEHAFVVPGVHGGLPLCVATGTETALDLPLADVLRAVLLSRRQEFLLVHTHVHDVGPSQADEAVTRRLVAASAVVGVSLVDHLVVTPTRHFLVGQAQAKAA